MRMKVIKITVLLLLIPFICMGTLFAGSQNLILGLFQGEHIDMQAMYDDMSELIPTVVYLQPEYTTGVEYELVLTLDDEIKNQMISGLTFKPVLMDKWLTSNYGNNKAATIFQFISDLKSERYSVNLSGVCKPYIYKIGKEYVIKISLYPFAGNGYPVSAVRVIKSGKDIAQAVNCILADLSLLFEQQQNAQTIRMAVAPFSINCKTLIEQKTGEFDFIATSFSNQEGVELKDTDDYFSELFAYQAMCTGLFAATTTQNIDEYISTEAVRDTAYAGVADYLVKGDIILSNKLNLITLQLVNARTGQTVRTTRHITKSFTLQEIWNCNYMFISDFCTVLFNQDEVKIIDRIDDDGRSFYMNGMFAGFDCIQHVPVKSGRTIINTGNNLTSDISVNPNIINEKSNKDFFIYTNNDEILIYKGREGAFVWNLLEK